MADLYRRDDGMWEISDPSEELDLVSDLAAAILFSYAALEGLGNHTIDQLAEDATVDVQRDGESIAVSRDRMEGTLSVPEKLSLVVPAFTKKPPIEGGVLSDKLARLCRLRDALLEDPQVIGLLMRGDADTCADDAIAVVRALRPEFLPPDLV
jgi:hypothetical protein